VSPRLLKIAEVAKLLNVSVTTLKRWQSSGLIASERTSGGHRRFRESDVKLLAASGRAEPRARLAGYVLEIGAPLALQSAILEMQGKLGSWWEFADSLLPTVADLHRRHASGSLTTVQWLASFERFQRAVHRFLEHRVYPSSGPSVVLASVPGDRVLFAPALLEIAALESRWLPRWAGGVSPPELGAELHRERADALIVSGSRDVDAAVMSRYAPALCAEAARTATPLAVIGFAPWPRPLPGAVRLHGFGEAKRWLEAIAFERAGGGERVLAPEAMPRRDGAGQGTVRAASPEGPERGELAWNEGLALGVPLIDEQHRQLFAQGGRFLQAVREGAPQAHLSEVLVFLGDYAEAHFRAEEHFMRDSAYPDTFQHVWEHEEFIANLRAMAGRLEANGDSESLRQEVAGFLHSWLCNHLDSSDRRIAAHVRALSTPAGDESTQRRRARRPG